MADQIYIGNFTKGLNDYTSAFNQDNDSFTYLFNMYVWRGRAKRKRGTVKLGRLTRQVQSSTPITAPGQYGTIPFTPGITFATANLLTFAGASGGASLVPGTINIGYNANIYTDPSSNGVLVGIPAGSGTINYSTGVISLPTSGVITGTGTYSYYPSLPVMGERDFTSASAGSFSNYPLLIAFDTVYAYQCDQKDVNTNFFSVSYYKITGNPVVWTGQDYQLFWSTNYPSTTTNQSGAFWATNNVPGFHGYIISAITVGNPTIITTSVNPNNVQTGDQVWFNNITGTDAASINQLVFTATRTGANTFSIPIDTGGKVINNSGLVQLLTNSVVGAGDGIRWYDGAPNSTGFPPIAPTTGWVNFAPPLTGSTVSINGLPANLYYLVGALAIVPFKDRLLFFSPYIQVTPISTPIQLQDTVIWSWNGTPFYNSLVPNNQTFDPKAYYLDQTGLGGYLPAGISQPILTVTDNEDVLLVGFGGNGRKTRFAYTGNELQPFLFYNINSELPSTSTFSSVVLDKGAIDIGSFGICMTDQQSAQRIDLDIPNAVFQIQKNNNGALRVNAIRDYINEWITFSYPVDDSRWRFPTQSFFFNYRENTWAVFYENYTCHGNYRANDTLTWATLPYLNWGQWSNPWNTGTQTDYEIQVIAGNPQGYVIVQGIGTGEGLSGSISAIGNDGFGNTQITSYNHCLSQLNPNTGTTDFIYIENSIISVSFSITGIELGTTTIITLSGMNDSNSLSVGSSVVINSVVGTTQLNGNTYTIIFVDINNSFIEINVDSSLFTTYVSGGTFSGFSNSINNNVYQVIRIVDANNFVINFNAFTGTYIGSGEFSRLSHPVLKTKQFPFYWQQGRQVRIGTQRYLLDQTANGQVTLNIYLSQDSDNAWNNPNIAGSPNGLEYSQTLFTCLESTNIGLTPANVNLQTPVGLPMQQIWHRINTSLIGDTFQIGITLNDDQMNDINLATAEIVLNGMQFTVSPGPLVS